MIIPYILSVGLFYIVYEIVISHEGFLQLFLNVSTLSFWIKGSHLTWYIALILPLYILYPILYKLRKSWESSIWFILFVVIGGELLLKTNNSVFLDNCEIAISRVPIFLAGLGCAEQIFKRKTISKAEVCIWFFIFVVSFTVISIFTLDNILLHYVYGVLALSFVILYPYVAISIRCSFMEKILSFCGGISLELYLIHVLIIRGLTVFHVSLPGFSFYILVPIVSVLLAYSLQKLSKKVSLIITAPKAR